MQGSPEGYGTSGLRQKDTSLQEIKEVTLGFSASQLIERANLLLQQGGLSDREQKGLIHFVRVCSEIKDGTEMEYFVEQVKAIENGSQNPNELAEFTHLPIICSDKALGQTLKIFGIVEAATGMAKPMIETHLQILPEIYERSASGHVPVLANYKGGTATDIKTLIGGHSKELKVPTVFLLSETSRTAQEFAFSRFGELERRGLITRERLNGELTPAQLEELKGKTKKRHHVVFIEQSPDQLKSSLTDIANSPDSRLDCIVLEKSHPYYPPELVSWITQNAEYIADTFVKNGMYFAAGYEPGNSQNERGIRLLLTSLKLSGGVATEQGGLTALLMGLDEEKQEEGRSFLKSRGAKVNLSSTSPLLAPFFSKEDLPGSYTTVGEFKH